MSHFSYRFIAFCALLSMRFSPLAAQDCSSIVIENKRVNGAQLAKTKPATFIVRGNYSYSIEFFTDEKGIFARVTSDGGVDFNQDDQFVFIDAAGAERAYKFINMAEVTTSSVKKNTLRLDLDALSWLASTTVTNATIINFVDRQKYKFQVNANRQSEFKQWATCFLSILDRGSVVNTPAAAVAKPGHGGPKPAGSAASNGTAPSPTGTSAGSSPSADNEVSSLRSELEKTKESLRAEIAAEKERGAAIKAQLQADVAAAREAADKKKLDYANEVLEARKTSQAEIDRIKDENAKTLAESKSKASTEVEKINLSVEDARRKAGEEISKARLAAAEEVAKSREAAAKEVASIKEKLDQSRLQYNDEVGTARANADDEIKRIRVGAGKSEI